MKKLLIEVGACDGADSLKFHRMGYRVFTFEPKKDLYESLIKKTSHLEDYTVIPKAVYNKNGTTTFNICRFGGASSILPFKSDSELDKEWSPSRTDIHYSGVSYEVETIRLDTFIEEYGLQDLIIDYIHIDAQGVDLECLMSLGKYINNVQEGVLETVKDTKKAIYVTQNINVLTNVTDFLQSNNFEVTKVESNDITGCEFNIFFKRLG
jgi:FkbM family methyltransferase